MRRAKQPKEAQIRRVAAMLAIERDSERIESFCREAFGASPSSAKALIQSAREYLALAADVDVREELGKRKEQLEDVRERARASGDLRVELAAIQELAKLCDLYKTTNVVGAASDVEGAIASLARSHLESLNVAPKGLPLEELARLVAQSFMNGKNVV